MSNKKLARMNQLFDELATAHGKSSVSNDEERYDKKAEPKPATQITSGRPTARRGRPPGVTSRTTEKVTVRITPELADCYRDWSWESRKSMSSLVESAMRHYRSVIG